MQSNFNKKKNQPKKQDFQKNVACRIFLNSTANGFFTARLRQKITMAWLVTTPQKWQLSNDRTVCHSFCRVNEITEFKIFFYGDYNSTNFTYIFAIQSKTTHNPKKIQYFIFQLIRKKVKKREQLSGKSRFNCRIESRTNQ